ncbi:MAG: ABC transporter permease, partial [Solobacterium sp.]|nr:ABC transporter permease [Solobacterium sp.]
LFGYAPVDNTYYLQFSGNNPEEVKKAVSACSDKIRLDTPDSIYDGTSSISFMYSLVILLLTLIGALLAFIILTNLISIYLTKKKKEVAVMRINGFTLYQCMRYLSQEIVIVMLAGLLSGTLIGMLVSPLVCHMVQPVDGRFLDAFNPRAWLFAFLIEALFVTSVSLITFRQVNEFNMLEDIIDP